MLAHLKMVNGKWLIAGCQGPLRPEVVESTQITKNHQANNVLCFGEEDAHPNNKPNYWLAKKGETEDQGFTMKVDNCSRLIAGFKIKNKGERDMTDWGTKDFRVSGSFNESSPWEPLMEARLNDTRGKPAPLLSFTFDKSYTRTCSSSSSLTWSASGEIKGVASNTLHLFLLQVGMWEWPKRAKNRGEPKKMTPSSETENFLGVVPMGKL